MTNVLALLGFASGIAANNVDTALGPWYLYYHPHLFHGLSRSTEWVAMTHAASTQSGEAVLTQLEAALAEHSAKVLSVIARQQSFCVIGGDHSCAIGTWSAVAYAKRSEGSIGMIWIDAHMDSHTPATSLTQNIHGMPVATLLGQGVSDLCHFLDDQPKVKPEYLCLIGLRSFEPEEQALLQHLGVRMYPMAEVQERGMSVVLAEACQQVTTGTCGFGVSIDMDAIDPIDAPGVGCPEPCGITAQALLDALQNMPHKQSLLGLELAEYNPICDHHAKTAQLLIALLQAMYS